MTPRGKARAMTSFVYLREVVLGRYISFPSFVCLDSKSPVPHLNFFAIGSGVISLPESLLLGM
jgi:hypothetical protein